ncbi:T-cell immunoglobulin and mucin domain-containing protein 4-like, partial [Engraulis encrasicolus]|uniref:T-cell immunoglobulin and mucin domain-containing protein 4-like n=1 Tax=Engraulis encrasicolus TaxID=184585 RepID=UPI002FD374A9
MEQLHGWFIWVFLCQLIAVRPVESNTVYGHTGQTVTLPCKYDSQYYGALSICWGKGELPSRGCGNQVIQTEGLRVTERSSPRYQLAHRQISAGDVSLTIYDAREEDSGTYGCRVDIPGWFNDEKYHMNLQITAAPTTTEAQTTLGTTVQTTSRTTTELSTTTMIATTSTEREWIPTEFTEGHSTAFTEVAKAAETTRLN